MGASLDFLAVKLSDLKKSCSVALVLRLLFLVYGQWQDSTMVVKYTDIDYEVFTDAAGHVLRGGSPYERATYRYTPLLAWIIVPNVTLHKAFGKLIFVFCDIVAGYLIYLILRTQGMSKFMAVKYSWFWLFNPMIITVSTRGNAESVLAVLVLSSIYFMLNRHFTLSAVMLALSVHFKIYPIIYALPLFLNVGLLAEGKKRANQKQKQEGMLQAIFSHMNHPYQFLYGLIASSTFLVINVIMYYIYGFEFLEHTYFYHVTRKDVKHNFSVYFYMLYLTMDTSFSWIISLLAFLPQLVIVLVFAVKYYKDLSFCCFVQTFAFVIFNKVCTSQYFLWYLSLMPLILPQVKINLAEGLKMVTAWFASQVLWLFSAYMLEFQGYNTMLLVWTASVLFFIVNIWILYSIIVNCTSIRSKKAN